MYEINTPIFLCGIVMLAMSLITLGWSSPPGKKQVLVHLDSPEATGVGFRLIQQLAESGCCLQELATHRNTSVTTVRHLLRHFVENSTKEQRIALSHHFKIGQRVLAVETSDHCLRGEEGGIVGIKFDGDTHTTLINLGGNRYVPAENFVWVPLGIGLGEDYLTTKPTPTWASDPMPFKPGDTVRAIRDSRSCCGREHEYQKSKLYKVGYSIMQPRAGSFDVQGHGWGMVKDFEKVSSEDV